ncbi:hypothetical protein BP00DRAFT_443712 [Aspergillus indologenus CBS 114.80]|uniref:Uncharacterized protein n=1 Tax=Aspergillus indologenus CBS 114.80 TaxID=1450541 RepID=A0A2V5J8C8_9EURO|nr:hypothetical protein BP00DRAFT_443712 [Aspergillus indologenus CBS 114.80]
MARLKPPASRESVGCGRVRRGEKSPPCWTRSDEQEHGKALRKQTNELAKRDREVNALLSYVDFLISLVNNEKTLSQARDATRFTYATVFFFPVGLAVTIFSMSGPPDHTASVGMVITAIVALVVTVAFLWLVIRVPTRLCPRDGGTDRLVGVFRAGKSEELIQASSVQEIVKPITANPEKVDEADTNEESISPAGPGPSLVISLIRSGYCLP